MTAYLGRVVRAVLPTVSASSAGGFWNPVMAQYYQQAGVWPSGAGSDPYFPYNTFLLNGNGTNGAQNNTFLDGSTNNFTITRNGNTTQGSFSPYVGPGNWSNYFDGSGDYLTVPAQTALSFGTGDFTIECWVFYNALSSDQGIIDCRSSAGVLQSWLLNIKTGGVVDFIYSGSARLQTAGLFSTNTWNHIAVTRASGTIRIFVNGAQGASVSYASAIDSSATNPNIGRAIDPAGTNGFISNLRVVKGAAVYTAAFTPPTTPLVATTQTTLLTCNNNGFNDMSAGNYTITRNGDASVSKFSPFTLYQTTPASYSGYFDGTGDYLTVPAGTAFNLSTSDFCIEMWVYPIAQSLYGALLTFDSGDFPLMIQWASAGSSNIRFYAGSSSAWLSGMPLTFGTTVLNSWQHLCVTRTSGVFRVFMNGILGATLSDATTIGDSSGNIYIGSNGTAGYATQAQISNLRIIKGSVPTTYQTSSTTIGATIFTPSTSPLTTTSQGATAANVSLLTCQSTTFIDNSTNAFTITANGNARPVRANPFTDTVTGPTPYAAATYGGSGVFDGAGDSLVLPANAAFSFGTGNFTIEAWAYPNSSGSYRRIFSQYTGAGATQVFLRQNNDNTLMFYVISSTTVIATITSSSSLTLNAWNHCAVSRNGSTFTLFLNGAVVGTASSASSMPDTSALNAYISTYDGGNEVWSGYISNLRVVKGTAVYTGPFVPPAAPVTAVANTQLLVNAANAGIFDSTTINNLETVSAAQISTSVVKYGTGSMSFSGGSSYLITPVIPPTVFFAPNAWTVEGWFYFNSLTGTSGLMGYPDLLEVTATSTTLVATYRNTPAGAKWSTITATVSLGTGAWRHIALVLNNGTMTLYVDGVSVGTPATAVGTPSWGGSGVQKFILGADDQYPFSGNPDVFLNGYIDDFRFTNGYARYTANFTPPTGAFPTF